MANPTYAVAGTFQQDAGNPFIQFTNDSGGVLYAINSSGSVSTVGGVTTAGVGQAAVVAAVSASLGFAVFNTAAAVNLAAAAAPAGTYRVSIYMVTTTAFVTNTEETITIGWTDDDQAQTVTYTTTAKTAGNVLVGSQLIRSTGVAAITYTPNVTGSPATAGVASLSVVLERLI